VPSIPVWCFNLPQDSFPFFIVVIIASLPHLSIDLVFQPSTGSASPSLILATVALAAAGVWRNADGSTGGTLPMLWDRTLPSWRPHLAWDAASWTPDAVIINLGTNDFLLGVPDGAAFQGAYVGAWRRRN
jgi:hypothetical protein